MDRETKRNQRKKERWMMQVKQSTKKRRQTRENRERRGREADDACQAIYREKAHER